MRLCAILTLVAALAVFAPAAATTYTVDVGGSGDYTEIARAVCDAAEGDTILVLPGTYVGEYNTWIDPDGMNLTYLAEEGREPVIIDGENTAPAFYFHTGEDATTRIRGFDIRNGEGGSGGGGMRIINSSPTIENCTFTMCHDSSEGGAIAFWNSSSTVSACVFRSNSTDWRGGAVYCYDSSTTITGCLFDENTVNSGRTEGAAVFCEESSDAISLCTMAENGPNQIYVLDGADVTISNCIVANGTEGVGVAASPTDGAMLTRSIMFGNAGGDAPGCSHDQIIYTDPRFCDDEADDYTLCDNSSAVSYNNIWEEQIGAFGSGCAECESPVEDSTWGAVKALFR